MKKLMASIGKNAKKASNELAQLKPLKKNKVLKTFSFLLKKNKKKILKANKKDLVNAKKNNLSISNLDRLKLNNERILQIINSLNEIIRFDDPNNKIVESWIRPNGIKIIKKTIPLGVIGVIFESRPNVTCDVSSLCFKSGNAVILRGGSEAKRSNKILVKLFRLALRKNNINQNCVQLIMNQDKKFVDYLLGKMSDYVDIIIPRGGKKLIKKVKKLASVPTIGHLEGICHVYIHKDASLNMAIKVTSNSKMRKTSSCGAAETLLIDKSNIHKNCKPILKNLIDSGCKIIADKKIQKIFERKLVLAREKDWATEYLGPKISVKCVDGINDAVAHVNKYGTTHTDTIVTKNKKAADYFLKNIKSAIAVHNASTQFADGGEFGFGAEVGISTEKLHPRGPVGLEQLTTYKYILRGSGQIRK